MYLCNIILNSLTNYIGYRYILNYIYSNIFLNILIFLQGWRTELLNIDNEYLNYINDDID